HNPLLCLVKLRRHRDGFLFMMTKFDRIFQNERESKMNIQEMILTLQNYWSKHDCILMQAYDVEKGAGTMSPMTLLRSLGPEPWNVAYVEPSRRPDDGRYGENPNRLYQ